MAISCLRCGSHLKFMLFYSLLIIVFLSPLPYGANRVWSWSLAASLIALLGILWASNYLIKKRVRPFHASFAIADIILVFLLVLLWIIAQQLAILPKLSHPLWQLHNALLANAGEFISLSLDNTLVFFMRYLSYGMVFWLSLCYAQRSFYAHKIVYVFTLAGFSYSLYGLLMLFSPRPASPALQSLSSTFINHNHFASFAGLSLLCCAALLYETMLSACSGRQLTLAAFLERLIKRTWFLLIAFMVIASALVLTHSRGGFLSSLLAFMVLIGALAVNKRARNRFMLRFFMLFIALGGSIFLITRTGLINRLQLMALSDPLREQVYGATWQAILTNPYLGFGAGSFAQAFPLYKTPALAGSIGYPLLWDYAHNVYLEIAFDLGLPAAIALCYCFLRLNFICLKGLFIRKKDWVYSALGLSASVLIGLHSLVDFSLQIPAIAYCYALLMGACCAQSFSSRGHLK